MRVGAYQCASPAGDIPAGLAVIDAALGGAAAAGIQMLVMPELFLPGYNAVTPNKPAGWDATVQRIPALCAKHNVALTIGLPEYTAEATYNSAFVWGGDGAPLASYRKVQLYGPRENALFEPGDQLQVFDHLGTRFGLLICYDIEFPEHARALNRAGASVILTPTANMMPYINVSTIQVPGRALENALTIVYANYTGSEGDLTYVGPSVVAGPDGYPLATRATDTGLLIADLPSGPMENAIPLTTQLADLRPAKPPKH
jgi:predicted amidohydrolase